VSISTKTGDDGSTSALGNGRLSKHDPRIEALGALDELDAFLSAVPAAVPGTAAAKPRHDEPLPPDGDDIPGTAEMVGAIRRQLSETVMVFAAGAKPGTVFPAVDKCTERLENWIALLEKKHRISGFVSRWTKPASVSLNIARAVCRRAERRITETDNRGLYAYINRLSDLLFLLAVNEEADRRAIDQR
jgi:cob(I)alamin adenosyltransferase